MRKEKTKNVIIILSLVAIMGLVFLNARTNKEKEFYQSALEEALVPEGQVLAGYQVAIQSQQMREYYDKDLISEQELENLSKWEEDFLINPTYEKAYYYVMICNELKDKVNRKVFK